MSLADELHAFTEDRKQHVANLIAPALARGEIVILDRYFYSTIAYQGARGGDVAAIEAEQRAIAPQPDVVLVFDLPPETSLARISESRGDTPNEFEKLDSLREVRRVFLDLAERDHAIKRIDGTKSFADVSTAIAKVLSNGVLNAKRTAKNYRAANFSRIMPTSPERSE